MNYNSLTACNNPRKLSRQKIHWKRQLNQSKILLLRQQCGSKTPLKDFIVFTLFTPVNEIYQLFSQQKTVGKVSPILVTLTSRIDSNFERSNISLKEYKRDGTDMNSDGWLPSRNFSGEKSIVMQFLLLC